jgi:hypothetical protein
LINSFDDSAFYIGTFANLKCCISNALDGSVDDILCEDNGEDKGGSDWVTDDSVMGDDQSDE